MWKSILSKKCKDLHFETKIDKPGMKITFKCSKMPDKKVKDDLKSIVPDNIELDFIESPKAATIQAIKNIILSGTYNIDNRKLIIHLTNLTQSFLSDIKEIVNSDNYFKSYEIYVNGIGINLLANEIEQNSIIREKIINSDDILNFIIHLNTSKTFDEFVKGA